MSSSPLQPNIDVVIPYPAFTAEEIDSICASPNGDHWHAVAVDDPATDAILAEVASVLRARYLANEKILRRLKRRYYLLRVRRVIVTQFRRAVLKAKQFCLVVLMFLLKLCQRVGEKYL